MNPTAPLLPPRERNDSLLWAVRVLMLLAVVAMLYLGGEILIPVALSLLLTFLFHPMVNWLMRRGRMPRVVAVIIAMTVGGAACVTLGMLVAQQAFDLADQLPSYQDNLRDKARSLRAASGDSALSRLTETIHDIQSELSATQPATTQAAASTPPASENVRMPRPPARVEPTLVRVVGTEPGVSAAIGAIVQPLLYPLAQGAIVALLLVFLLLYSDDVRERIIWIAGKNKISLTTSALDEIGTRIGGYLRMQLIINVIHGGMVMIGLLLMGVPNALLWGLLAAALRFIPYLGPWLGAILPILLAFAVFNGWGWPLAVVGMFIVIELISNMVLEPFLYGESTGLSTIGVVLAAVFWGWLWGPVGLILAVPLTVCLVVIGKHVPQLGFLHHLLGRESVMPTSGRLYQRLLVGDEITAREILSAQLETRPFVEVCDEIVLPVLEQLKRDWAAGLNSEEQTFGALRLLDMVCVPDDDDASNVAPGSTTAEGVTFAPLLCAATQNEVDDLAAMLLCRAAVALGIPSQMTGSRSLASEVLERVRSMQPATAVIVQVTPISGAHTRHLLKTLARNDAAPGMELIELSIATPEAEAAPADTAADKVAPKPRSTKETNADHIADVRHERLFAPTLRRVSELHQVQRPPPSSELNVKQSA